ncbi:MAG: hypothetical protein FWD57_10285, partial [Polyangiaceae bacterium]|nr:hypothetical protein [Polyangiaceae bacterium]
MSLERITRQKYDARLDEFLPELVESNTLALPEQYDIVSVNSFTGNAFVSQRGTVRVESPKLENLSLDIEPAASNVGPAFNCPHELAHIASCLPFFGEFKNNSLLVSFDGGASLGNFAAFHYVDGELHLLDCGWKEMGYLSKFYNDNPLVFAILGANRAQHCSVPGKLMGYACWGQYDERIEQWLRNNNYFHDASFDSHAILQS